jgi:Protein of unknown function (DUF1236)
MTSKLLLTTALLASVALASAQSPGGQSRGSQGGAMQEGGAPSGATAPAGQPGQDRQSPPRGAEGGKDKQGQAHPGTQGQRGQKEQTAGQAPQGGQGKDADKGQQTQSPGHREPNRGTAETPRDQRQGQSPQRQDGQSQIRETVLSGGNAPRANNVNFSISVGTTVPTTVRIVEVPAVIMEVHPEYRGHMYFVVGDEIIIVDRNHRIVAVLTV